MESTLGFVEASPAPAAWVTVHRVACTSVTSEAGVALIEQWVIGHTIGMDVAPNIALRPQG